MIDTTELLWTLKGVSIDTIYSTIEGRPAMDCWSAFEMHRASESFDERDMLNALRLAHLHGHTATVMAATETTMREKIARESAALGDPILEVGVCGSLELYALLVEGFVRMGHRGLPYPQHTPRDLLFENR